MSDMTLEGLGELGADVAAGKKVPVRRISLCKGLGKKKKCIRVAGKVTVTSVPNSDQARAAKFFGRKPKNSPKDPKDPSDPGGGNGKRKPVKKIPGTPVGFNADQKKLFNLYINRAIAGNPTATNATCTMTQSKKKGIREVAEAIIKQAGLKLTQCAIILKPTAAEIKQYGKQAGSFAGAKKGKGRKSGKKHPCSGPNPAGWCNKK